MYPIINSCSDFDDIFDGCWKKMNSYIKKTFKVYDTSHGAFSIDISDNKSDKKTSEVEKSSSVLDSSSNVSCESKTLSDKNSNLIVSSDGLYIYDATELFKSLDACFSRIVYDKNYYLYSEYGLVNHNYCTSYDESLKSGVHGVIRKLINRKLSSSSIIITTMEVYNEICKHPKFDKTFEGCKLEVDSYLKDRFSSYDEKNGPFVFDTNTVGNKSFRR